MRIKDLKKAYACMAEIGKNLLIWLDHVAIYKSNHTANAYSGNLKGAQMTLISTLYRF